MIKYSSKINFYLGKVYRRVKVGRNRALYRTAGLIRTSAKRNLRIRSGPGRPGKPPHAHRRGGLRVIQFHVSGNKAIVGPLKFPRSNEWNEPVPFIHEFGGTFIRRSRIPDEKRTLRRVRYPQRSFMGETLERLMRKDKIPKQFRVSIAEVL